MRPEDGAISPNTSLIELGIDSLVAVDMRIWFTRELDLDLPVLKLLGGATVEDMVEDAVSRLDPGLIPNVKDAPKTEAQASESNTDAGASQSEAVDQDTSEDASSEGSSAGVTDEFGLATEATEITPPESVKGVEDSKDSN